MSAGRARGQLGFSLLELIVAVALMTALFWAPIQFISVFYRYRLADGITSTLLSQSARVQAEFQYFCTNASAIRMYASQPARSSQSLSQGNYFEATFVAQSNADSGTNQTLIRGLEYVKYDSTHGALREWYYDRTGTPLGPPVTLCANYVQMQPDDQGAFGFRHHVPFMEYRLGLPANTGPATVGPSSSYFDVTAYAKPLYMQ